MSEEGGVRTGFAAIHGDRLYYEVAGDGPALVLAHAGIADLRMWDDQFLAFARGYRVIRFDFWGFGRSTIASEEFSLHQDLVQLLKFLGVTGAHLVGSSLGGRVSIDLALTHPEIVRSLVVVGSGLSGYRFSGEVFTRFAEEVYEARQEGDFDREIELKLGLWIDGRSRAPEQVDPGVRARAREMLLGRPGRQGEGQGLEPPAMGRLSKIAAPTLVIVGDRDEANIAAIADLLVADIPGAQKSVIPDSAHLANMENPALFNRLVLGFLKKIRP